MSPKQMVSSGDLISAIPARAAGIISGLALCQAVVLIVFDTQHPPSVIVPLGFLGIVGLSCYTAIRKQAEKIKILEEQLSELMRDRQRRVI